MTNRAFFTVLTVFFVMQGNAIASPRISMSLAGQEILKSTHDRLDQDLMKIIRTRAETRKKIDLQLRAEHHDWKIIKMLINLEFSDQARMRNLYKIFNNYLLDKLPETDRIIYVREKFPSSLPPVIITSPNS